MGESFRREKRNPEKSTEPQMDICLIIDHQVHVQSAVRRPRVPVSVRTGLSAHTFYMKTICNTQYGRTRTRSRASSLEKENEKMTMTRTTGKDLV